MSISDSNFWDRRKNKDYTFIDNTILDYFDRSGVGILIHKYTGTYPSGYDGSDTTDDYFSSDNEYSQDNTSGDTDDSANDLLSFEDSFFGENTNRSYDPVPYEVKCVYQMSDFTYSLEHWGQWLNNDEHYILLHLNDSLRKLGRKVLAGDVIEMLHMRDDALLDPLSPAINKFYQVTEVTRPGEGYSATWYPHLLRLKIVPMTNSQEFQNITTENQDGIISGPGYDDSNPASDNSNESALDDMDEAILDEAQARVKYRFLETEQFYVVNGSLEGRDFRWIFAGSGIPPNGAELSGKGYTFPTSPTEGEWFLRFFDDYANPKLYQYQNGSWIYKDTDFRRKWESASRILETFINNNRTTTVNGTTIPQKQGLSKVMLPKATIGPTSDIVFDPDTDLK